MPKILDIYKASFAHSFRYLELPDRSSNDLSLPYRHFTVRLNEVQKGLQEKVTSVQPYAQANTHAMLVISAPSYPQQDVLLNIRIDSKDTKAIIPQLLDQFRPDIYKSKTYMDTHTLGFTFELSAHWIAIPLEFNQAMKWAALPCP